MKWLLLFATLLLVACGETTIINNPNPNLSLEPEKPEPAYCSAFASIGDPVTISGTATYQRRVTGSTGLEGPSAARPIRHAEVAIIDASGNVLECGKTDASGNFSINIERTSSNVFVEIRSRALNSQVQASVLDNHTNVLYHAIQSSEVVGNSNQNVGTINAPYNGSLEGGAFHILDLIFQANEFLRNETTGCDGSFTNCRPISVADKVTVFWEKGFNPATYLGMSASNTLSFYLGGTSRLYIVGGVNGDTDNTDTDHFDDVIVLHEYGHFIEDNYSVSDSPGGSHDGNSLIDARLSWSEGWATYFANEVLDYPHYIDTTGNEDGTTSYLIKYNVESNTSKRDPSSVLYTQQDGEGNFREFAIARVLWDATDLDADASDTDNDGYEASFDEFWTIFAGTNTGAFANSNVEFRFAGKFFSQHDSLVGRTDIKTLLNSEFIYDSVNADFIDHYAQATPLGACGAYQFSIAPANGNSKSEDGSFANSNQFASNDFFEYTHGGGSLNISLTHDGAQDLDLYIYEADYTYGDTSTMIGSSDSTSSTSESVSISASAGKYLINVRVFPTISGTLDTSTAQYDLTINSNKVCP